MEDPSTPIPYTDEQVERGVTRSEVVNNQAANNILWTKDRVKLYNLQNYIKTLMINDIISN